MDGEHTERVDWIDALKGFAILLVIVGHLIQTNYQSGIGNTIFNIIYSFHMPLFFFISGMCLNFSRLPDKFEGLCVYAGKKVIQLIIPSILWAAVVPAFFDRSLCIPELSIGLFRKFWFLQSLFVIVMLTASAIYIGNKINRVNVPVVLLLVGAIAFFAIGVKRVSLMYLIMFILGYLGYKDLNLMGNRVLVCISAIFFILLAGHFEYGDSLSGNPDRVWMELPLSVAASFVLVNIFKLESSGRLMNVLAGIGKYTLGIYLVHFLLVRIPIVGQIEFAFPSILQFIILLVAAFFIASVSIGIQKVLEHIPILGAVLFGEYNVLLNKAKK